MTAELPPPLPIPQKPRNRNVFPRAIGIAGLIVAVILVMFFLKSWEPTHPFWTNVQNIPGEVVVDWENPSSFVYCRYTNSISEIKVFVAEPTEGFDTYRRIGEVLKLPSVFSTTNQVEVGQLSEALQDYSREVWPVGFGYTYHIVLVEPGGNQVMHFRVFVKDIEKDEVALVYPRSMSKFGYSNRKIVPWLRAHQGVKSFGKEAANPPTGGK